MTRRRAMVASLWLRAGIAATALLVCGAAPGWADSSWQKIFSNAQRQAAAGASQNAEAEFRAALKVAQTPRERSDTAVALADLLVDATPASPPNNPVEIWTQAADFYRLAMEQAAGRARLIASNNYAALLVRLGRAPEAVEILAKIEMEMRQQADQVGLARYLYSYGRALEAAGRPREALASYAEAVDRDAALEMAVIAARRVAFAVEDRSAGIAGLAGVVDRETARRNLPLAEDLLRSSFGNEPWRQTVAIGQMMLPLIRFLTVSAVGPTEFRERWQPAIQAETLRGRVQQLDELYFADLPLILDASQAYELRQRYGNWSEPGPHGEDLATFSAFVQGIGDAYARAGDPKRALPRYNLAWLIGSGDAALSFANVLLTSRKEVDPEGALLDQVVNELFNEKALAIQQNDLKSQVRLHSILGQIFESQGERRSPSDPRSAVFQWSSALREQRQLTGDAAVSEEIPGLLAHLGTAYATLGDADQAWASYALSAQGFLKVGRGDAAKAVWQKAKSTSLPRPAGMGDQFKALDAQLQ